MTDSNIQTPTEAPSQFRDRRERRRFGGGLVDAGGHAPRIYSGRIIRGPGTRGSANTLDGDQLSRVFEYIDAHSNVPTADRLKLLFSFHAGLRAAEIQGLNLDDVLDPDGMVGQYVTVRSANAKNGRERQIQMTDAIREGIKAFRQTFPNQYYFAISGRGEFVKRQSVNALTIYMRRIYIAAGFRGCSSHTGRRSFATELARAHTEAGCSLRDVQELLGHARLDTTERYIQRTGKHRDLVEIAGREFARRA